MNEIIALFNQFIGIRVKDPDCTILSILLPVKHVRFMVCEEQSSV